MLNNLYLLYRFSYLFFQCMVNGLNGGHGLHAINSAEEEQNGKSDCVPILYQDSVEMIVKELET